VMAVEFRGVQLIGHLLGERIALLGHNAKPLPAMRTAVRLAQSTPCADVMLFCVDRTLRLRIRRSSEFGCSPSAFAASV